MEGRSGKVVKLEGKGWSMADVRKGWWSMKEKSWVESEWSADDLLGK